MTESVKFTDRWLRVLSLQTVDLGFLYFIFHFHFHFIFPISLFLEQLGLKLEVICYTVTSVTIW